MQQLRSVNSSFLMCGRISCGIGEMDSEIDFSSCTASGSITHRNLVTARPVIQKVFAELELQCIEEREQYRKSNQTPPEVVFNRWATYTNKTRVKACMSSSLEFIKHHPECRSRLLSCEQLRFLILLQHFVAEDTRDVYLPECQRKHSDVFEGILTEGAVNSQLIKDAHRSEWSIEGRPFSLQAQLTEDGTDVGGDRWKQVIAAFQRELVIALETCLLEYCCRRGLSQLGTRRFLQVVTTQMSQCGLANLGRSSQAARYFVSGQGLDQRTTYNLSTMDGSFGESLQLSMLCMKTGFCQYQTEDTLGMPGSPGAGIIDVDAQPMRCAPSSYLYQYATLRFTPGHSISGCESAECVVIDALDEVHIESTELLSELNVV